MNRHDGRRVLVVGAGSMGIIVGYHLSLAGADVTFLVRPHRAKEMQSAQLLYCFNDNQIKTFSKYGYTTDPSSMIGAAYDYILITLDGASLRNEVGQDLVRTIGKAVQGTDTAVVVGAVFPELKPWFLSTSGLSGEQVIMGLLYIHVYPVKRLEMPTSPPVDAELVAKADFAYTDCLGPGMVVDDGSPTIANGFADLYNASRVSRCDLVPLSQAELVVMPMFPVFAVCELMGWPKFQDIGQTGQPWSLGVAAAREIQGLDRYGDAGRAAADNTTEEGFATMMAGMETTMLPFELQVFNRFHHGGKVNVQDTELLHACLASGEAEGKPMTALRELVQQVKKHRAGASQ